MLHSSRLSSVIVRPMLLVDVTADSITACNVTGAEGARRILSRQVESPAE